MERANKDSNIRNNNCGRMLEEVGFGKAPSWQPLLVLHQNSASILVWLNGKLRVFMGKHWGTWW